MIDFLELFSSAEKRRGRRRAYGPEVSTLILPGLLVYFAWLAETLTLICFGLDSSRLGMRTFSTPLRYSA